MSCKAIIAVKSLLMTFLQEEFDIIPHHHCLEFEACVDKANAFVCAKRVHMHLQTGRT